jgi:CRP-like cAMP-binding protein
MPTHHRQELESLGLRSYFDLEHWEQFLQIAEDCSLRAGEYLFHEGEQNPFIYLLIDGQIDLSMKVPGRGDVRILSLGRGDLVAWSAVLGKGKMTCSAVATLPCELVRIHHQEIERFAQHDPRIGLQWMKMMADCLAQRLTATRLQLLDLFTHESEGLL